MNNKIIFFILIVICVSLCLLLTACGTEGQGNTQNTSAVGTDVPNEVENNFPQVDNDGTDNEKPTHIHTYGEWQIVTNPTCTENGEMKQTCSCGEERTELALAKGHSYKSNKCFYCDSVIQKSEGLEFVLNEDKLSYTVAGIGTCTSSEISIPSEYNGLPVTGIGDGAFENCTIIVIIIIPNSVTSIGNNAFKGCTELSSVSLPESVKTIGNSSFEGCAKLIVVIIAEGLESIGENAFANCTSLLTFSIPTTLKNLGTNAFLNCVKLIINTVIEELPAEWELDEIKLSVGHQHSYSDWSITKEPTCDKNGTKEQYCECGSKNIEKITTIPHIEQTVLRKEPTCTETGLTEGKKCTVCGDITVKQETIDAKGHNEEAISGKEPTCTETGLTEGKKCISCGDITVKQETIGAKGHSEEAVPGKEPT